jgi:hypothetical protein
MTATPPPRHTPRPTGGLAEDRSEDRAFDLGGHLPDGFAESLAAWPDPAAADGFMSTDPGYDTAWWDEAMRSGWFGRAFAAEFGGCDDFAALVAAARCLGARAVPTPLVDGVVLSGFALAFAGDEPARDEHLRPLLSGERRYATCLTGPSGLAAPDGVAVRATRRGSGWHLDGCACFVPYAGSADVLLVLAESEHGPALFAVESALPGVRSRTLPTLGGDRQGEIRFAEVALPASALIGTPGAAWQALRPAVDRALVAQCSDLLGAADAAMRYAVAHVRGRVQWGVPLASFQAVQHRCADMFTAVTLCRDAVAEAAELFAAGGETATTASALKAFCAPLCRQVSASAHQLGGGEGIHADVPLHLWYRRIKAAEPALGGPRHHRARVARALLAGAAPAR